MNTKNCASLDFLTTIDKHFMQIANDTLFTDSSSLCHANRETITPHHRMKDQSVKSLSFLK